MLQEDLKSESLSGHMKSVTWIISGLNTIGALPSIAWLTANTHGLLILILTISIFPCQTSHTTYHFVLRDFPLHHASTCDIQALSCNLTLFNLRYQVHRWYWVSVTLTCRLLMQKRVRVLPHRKRAAAAGRRSNCIM